MRVLVYPLQQSRVAEKGINAERDIGKQRPPYPLAEYLRSVAVEYHEPVLYEALTPAYSDRFERSQSDRAEKGAAYLIEDK